MSNLEHHSPEVRPAVLEGTGLNRSITPRFWAAVASVGIAGIGLLAPWVKIIGLANVSINGLDTGDGKVIAVSLVLAGLLAAWYAKKPSGRKLVGLAAVGLGIAALGVYEMIDLNAKVSDINNAPDGMSLAAASVGWGVYAVMIVVPASSRARSPYSRRRARRRPSRSNASLPTPGARPCGCTSSRQEDPGADRGQREGALDVPWAQLHHDHARPLRPPAEPGSLAPAAIFRMACPGERPVGERCRHAGQRHVRRESDCYRESGVLRIRRQRQLFTTRLLIFPQGR